MTKLEIFNKMMTKAKANGYTGPDYKYEIGYILDGTNIYSVIFRQDFAKALWGDSEINWNNVIVPSWQNELRNLGFSEDRWKYLEENTNLY